VEMGVWEEMAGAMEGRVGGAAWVAAMEASEAPEAVTAARVDEVAMEGRVGAVTAPGCRTGTGGFRERRASRVHNMVVTEALRVSCKVAAGGCRWPPRTRT
jgi:hypothetical protein